MMQVDRTHRKDALAAASKKGSTDFSRLAHRVAPNGFCKDHPCRALLSVPAQHNTVASSQLQARGTVGKTAALSQAGYEKVASLKDDTEMKEYIKRVIDKYDCRVVNEGGLSGIVPWFSGTTMTQSLPQLEDTLLYAVLSSPSWLAYKNSDHINGDKAELSFMGYVQVAAMKSDDQMKKFVARVCHDMGVKIVDEGGFTGMVKYYSGHDNFQSFDRLRSEIKSAANAPHSWAQWVRAPANTAASSPSSRTKGFSLLAVRTQLGFCSGYPCRVPGHLQLLQTPSSPQATSLSSSSSNSKQSSREVAAAHSSPKESGSRHGIGKDASLDQAGYVQVSALQDDDEMKEFIMRMVEKYDCKVVEIGGLMGIVPWFSGTTSTQDIQKLEDTLLFAVLTRSKPWLSYKNSDHITGDTAKLGFVGYVQVAAMRNDSEMKKFVRRVCKDMGVNVVDEGGFEGMVKYYSGTDNFQSYERLQSEIKSAANAPHSWAEWIHGPPKEPSKDLKKPSK
jgi:hypothetical protein